MSDGFRLYEREGNYSAIESRRTLNAKQSVFVWQKRVIRNVERRAIEASFCAILAPEFARKKLSDRLRILYQHKPLMLLQSPTQFPEINEHFLSRHGRSLFAEEAFFFRSNYWEPA